jgi:hypothetical protein
VLLVKDGEPRDNDAATEFRAEFPGVSGVEMTVVQRIVRSIAKLTFPADVETSAPKEPLSFKIPRRGSSIYRAPVGIQGDRERLRFYMPRRV